jgi:hypothetical protein
MTLVAYAVHKDRAEILTDSLAYTADAADVIPSTKCVWISHLNAAIATTGSYLFGRKVVDWALHLREAPEINGLAEQAFEAFEAFPKLWDEDYKKPMAVFMFGWSNVLGRSLGFLLGADKRDLVPWHPRNLLSFENIGDHTLTDGTAWNVRPHAPVGFGGAQRGEVAADGALHGTHPDDMPTTEAEWVTLGRKARAHQATLPPDKRIVIGGHLTLTTITNGSAHQRIVHRFDDTGDEWARLLAGTANPAGAAHKWTGVGRNEPCPCASGRKYKHCHLQGAR